MHSSRMERTDRCSGRGGGVYPSMHWVGGGEGLYAIDACENITLPQLRFGR